MSKSLKRALDRELTVRRLVTAVAALRDPRGSTPTEIIEWAVENRPCQHPPPQGSQMERDRARLLAGLRYCVKEGMLAEHGGRYKLAIKSCLQPWPGPARQDARPSDSWDSTP